ncbi:MAG: hypothetical protein ACJA2E_001494 [Arenicella sp.]|jgi:hypothetical protein
MIKALIEENCYLIHHDETIDAAAVIRLATEAERLTCEKSIPSVNGLDDIEAFLIPAYYQTDD